MIYNDHIDFDFQGLKSQTEFLLKYRENCGDLGLLIRVSGTLKACPPVSPVPVSSATGPPTRADNARASAAIEALVADMTPAANRMPSESSVPGFSFGPPLVTSKANP